MLKKLYNICFLVAILNIYNVAHTQEISEKSIENASNLKGKEQVKFKGADGPYITERNIYIYIYPLCIMI